MFWTVDFKEGTAKIYGRNAFRKINTNLKAG
jgi:hypothetical protein